MEQKKKYNALKLAMSKWLKKPEKNQSKRVVEVCSLNNAKTVGVTFVVWNQNEMELIKKFLKQLTNMGINTFALGYIPEKKPNDFYLSEKSCNFFYDKELDWFLRPNSTSAVEFREKKFDILIDIGGFSFYPLQHLLFAAKASFKVGRFVENSPFDFMLNIEPNKGNDYYFSQVIHYLSQLN